MLIRLLFARVSIEIRHNVRDFRQQQKLIEKILPDGAKRHRVLGRFTMVIYALILVTSTATYLMLYFVYPLKS